MANLEMFPFVLMMSSCAEWTVIVEFKTWNAALLPTLILHFVFAGDMLDLLKWRTHPDKIAGCLSKLKEIDGSEIVKVCTPFYTFRSYEGNNAFVCHKNNHLII